MANSRWTIWLVGASLLCVVAGPATAPGADAETRERVPSETEQRIRRLVQNLASSSWRVRDRASHQIAREGARAIPALREAAAGTNPEVASRARDLLATIERAALLVLDARGLPIAQATVELEGPEGESMSLTTVASGHGGLPVAGNRLAGRSAIVEHEAYGRAVARVEVLDDVARILVPLVRERSTARERSLRGRVVDPDGRPVSGARVRCGEVRTLGEGLIQPRGDAAALTDADGRFLFYPLVDGESGERGDLVPPGSRYSITVEGPEGADLFVHAGRYPAGEEARIRLAAAGPYRSFGFEAPGGGRITDAERLRSLSITFRAIPESPPIAVPPSLATATGGRLRPGTYSARIGELEYAPLVVRGTSPGELEFRLLPAALYAGRVVDGTTGEPLADALVIAFSSTARQNLALLSKEDWRGLETVSQRTDLDDPALRAVREHYGIDAVDRTDPDGFYQLFLPPGETAHSILAFARDRVPCRQRALDLKRRPHLETRVPELPLFPAARVLVRPAFEEGRLSVSPRWVLASAEQPEWCPRLREALRGGGEGPKVEYVHWLRLNERQPLLVPAGVALRMRFEAPYDDEWTPRSPDREIRLHAREEVDLGEITFERSLAVTVRVVDERGRGIEGAPVRRQLGSGGSWSVAHDSDADGVVRFWIPRGATGHFRVSGLPRGGAVEEAARLKVPFRVGDEAPSDPLATIRLSDRQVEGLLGGRPTPVP